MRTLQIRRGGEFLPEVPAADISRMLRVPDVLLWLDVAEPDAGDLSVLAEEFGFHPLAIEDAVRPHERPKVDLYEHAVMRTADAGEDEPAGLDSYYFVIFYEAEYIADQDTVANQPISMFIGPNFLVTVHSHAAHHVQATRARWLALGGERADHVGWLVHSLLDSIVDDYFPIMDQVADKVDEIEDAIFVDFDEKAIETIFGMKKGLLNLRRVVAPERDVLNVLLRRDLPIFRDEDMAYLQDVYDHLVRVAESADIYRDLLSSALDSFLSLQSNNMSRVMKFLTMGSIVLMSAALIAGIYGMNFVYMPELDEVWGYPWALGLMLLVSSILVLYFRRNKWL